MTPRLQSVTVENFRSIRGRVSVSLDAPVVLIHGQNGTGKTSLLSAIEMCLTGDVPSLRRVEPDYMQHLPHKLAPNGLGKISLDVAGRDGPTHVELSVTQQQPADAPRLLSGNDARFYSERCYLAQSMLGRLLEIYQSQDARKTDSPLTRFVKELLGLDHLDALIDGLYPAGDVRRFRDPVPAYWAARQDLPVKESQLERCRQELLELKATVNSLEERVRIHVAQLLPDARAAMLNPVELHARLAHDNEEVALSALARTRRDLKAISDRWSVVAERPDSSERGTIETEAQDARAAVEHWRTDVGTTLDRTIEELRTFFPNLQTTATSGVDAVRLGAIERLEAELRRIARALASELADGARAAQLQQDIDQGRARTKVLEQQVVGAAGVGEGLAQSLSEILPHVHGEDCPVCGRDFGEVSRAPLKAHLSARIASLVEASSRLQALVRDKTSTSASVAAAERELDAVNARRLRQDQLDTFKRNQARFEELRARLVGLEKGTALGLAVGARAAAAARRLADLRANDEAANSLRLSLDAFAVQLSQSPLELEERVDAAVRRLELHVESREHELVERQGFRRSARSDLIELESAYSRRAEAEKHLADLEKNCDRLRSAKAEADRRIDLAKHVVQRTRDARATIVRRVFNEELNAVWRDLFVRLAPDEDFIPAFALPVSASAPVTAVLETHYRAGGKGGNPRAMLSAGNLNTAALTLFLALHLSVKPTLPWLVIDDPVQSMDEVHIAQFAALLRTLSKQKGRQIIVAVHERPLFEYLSLELGPAYPEDRLVTIELGRASDGTSTAVWEIKTYEPDRAIAA